ncbi:MAG: hypothetical protein LBG83_00575 [Oscillospiraceae bacterium]|jgi:hypothetical protein|nr:hypothetical protein [Oscillospiraceae bacterium]
MELRHWIELGILAATLAGGLIVKIATARKCGRLRGCLGVNQKGEGQGYIFRG